MYKIEVLSKLNNIKYRKAVVLNGLSVEVLKMLERSEVKWLVRFFN